jgi:carboxyl-terminal processing protease
MHANRSWTRLLPLALILFLGAARADAAELSCDTIGKFAARYLDNHIRHHQLTDELKQRTVSVFIRSFDPSQSVMLEADVEKLRKDLSGIFEAISKDDCSGLHKAHRVFVERHRAVEKHVATVLEPDSFEIDPTVEVVVDAEERGYPKTKAEQEALIRSLIHFQMSNLVSESTTLDEAEELLRHRYELRTKRIDEQLDQVDIYSAFLDAFATSLDPHSNYFSAQTYEDFRISMSLSLIGIGVALSENDGFAVVERVIPGGAADQLDVLRPKDKIIEVAQGDEKPVNIIDMSLREAVSLIRGKKGTEVRLTVLRQGETTERFEVAIVRDEINLDEQAASLRFEEREVDGQPLKLAILELPSFYGDTNPSKRQCTDDVAKLLREVAKANADGLVLDLSRNGGGLLTHAVTVSGFFLRKGEIVKVQNSRGQQEVLRDRDEAVLYSGPLVIHTSRVSASAAEILAGALKDYKRAVIAGDDHTFGKGTVQTVSSLPPGQGALKITTAMFYRPGGKSTQHGGVEADVVIPSVLSGDDFGEKHQPFSIEGAEIDAFQSSFAIANPESQRWAVIGPEIVEKLATESGQRISANPEFAEVDRKLAEAKKNAGVIKLADLMKRREEEREKSPESEDGEEAEEDEDKPSPQLVEATNVLVDLIALSTTSSQERKTAAGGM